MPNPDLANASPEDLVAALEARAEKGEVPETLNARLAALVGRTRPQADGALSGRSSAPDQAQGSQAPPSLSLQSW